MGQKITYDYCPQCRGKLIVGDEDHPYCPVCNITIYNNVASAASVLPVRDGQVLLVRRGRDPFKGALDLVGGFIEPGETAPQAAVRETKEETGLDVELTELFGVYSDQYGDEAYTLGAHYLAKIIGGTEQAGDDAAALEWHDIASLTEAQLADGFKNTRDTLMDLQKRRPS